MPWGTKAMNYVKNGFSTLANSSAGLRARSLHNSGMSRFGATGMSAMYGAAGGTVYGGTIGRDPGQSRLGGAFTGALGGAALGAGGMRYGTAAVRGGAMSGAARRYGTARAFGAGKLNAGFNSMGAINFRGAGKDIASQMRMDARSSLSYVGRSITRARNSFSAMGR